MKKTDKIEELDISSDQTTFGVVEPILEDTWKPQPTSIEDKPQTSKKWFQKRMFQIGFVATLMLITTLLMTPLLFPQSSEETIDDDTPLNQDEVQVEESDVRQRLNAVNQALENSKQADESYPFPPVDLLISLEQL